MARQARVPATRATTKSKRRVVSQIQMTVIFIDEYDSVRAHQVEPFVNGPEGKALDKAVAFLAEGGIQNMLNTFPTGGLPQEAPQD